MTSGADRPDTVCQLDTPAAQALQGLASVFDELQTVLRCCERLVAELDAAEPDDLILESLWTTTVLSYTRCFAARGSGVGLTEQDLRAAPLQGEVLEWHKVLRQLGRHYADPVENPRARFAVGTARDSHGRPNGVAITATPRPGLDDRTVRQTGALAYELSGLVDQRICDQQQRALTEAEQFSDAKLDQLPVIDVTTGE